MTRYARGADFERETRDVLLALGFWTMRAAGSHGKVDVLAIRPESLLLIQCKIDGKCSPAERKEVIRVAGLNPLGIPLVAYRHKEGRAAATVRFYRLTGTGPYDRTDWSPEQ